MSHIKSLINNFINGHLDEASLDIHQHLKGTLRKLLENPVKMEKNDILKIAQSMNIPDVYMWEIKRAVKFDEDYSREDLMRVLKPVGLEHFADEIADKFEAGAKVTEDHGEQMYKLQWPNMKFGVRKGQTLIVPFRWFSGDGGFDRAERAQIKAMVVGDKIELGEEDQLITIERVSDDTPTSDNAW
jgi:hypothetical protein